MFYLTLASGEWLHQIMRKYPITTVEGGPIAGIIGGIILGELLDENDIIVIDGGSTTTKAGLATSLTPQAKWNIGLNKMIGMQVINQGASYKYQRLVGGTSIVWVDEAKPSGWTRGGRLKAWTSMLWNGRKSQH